MADRVGVVVSCEHAGNEVPDAYRHLFGSEKARAALDSHRGWDPGALGIAEGIAARLGAPLFIQTVSRLLVECNRSVGHARLWSEFSRGLTPPEKEKVLDLYWRPHRNAVRSAVVETGVTVHVGIHTFTPLWKGRARPTETGILYDPARPGERRLAHRWRDGLAGTAVHLNRPYRGWTDALVTTLRAELSPTRYRGMELEVSQASIPLSADRIARLADTLAEAIADASSER